MNYDQLELDVLGRLAPLQLAGVDVVLLPETEAEYKRPITRSRVTIVYKESTFPEITQHRSMGYVIQEEVCQVEVIIWSRKLRGSHGIHVIAREVMRLLVGFEPTDCMKMYLVKNAYHMKDGELWSYSAIFATHTQVVEDYTAPSTPLLQAVMFNLWAGQVPGVIGLPNGTALVLPTNQMIIPN